MAPATLLQAFERQAESCRKLGAEFTADVIETLAEQLRGEGPLTALLPDWPGDPSADAVPLRLCGALHALALGQSDALAALYPPQATRLDRQTLVRELNNALASDPAFFETMLRQPPQTNEIGRSAVLLGGFAEIARRTRLPLALLEIGASAGLNLRWDRYRFELGQWAWGDASSLVRVAAEWRGAPPTLPQSIQVGARAGCDRAPLNPRSEADRRSLLAYCWPEQSERVARLKAALDLTASDGFTVERADAAPWLDRQLANRRLGLATVVYHSIVWQYLSNTTREAVRNSIHEAGRRATADAPVAWLRFEFEGTGHRPPELTLRVWPGAARQRLATGHPHGASVDWLRPTQSTAA